MKLLTKFLTDITINILFKNTKRNSSKRKKFKSAKDLELEKNLKQAKAKLREIEKSCTFTLKVRSSDVASLKEIKDCKSLEFSNSKCYVGHGTIEYISNILVEISKTGISDDEKFNEETLEVFQNVARSIRNNELVIKYKQVSIKLKKMNF